ncbi:MAG: hypothetical protein ACFFBH_07250 [Promethearchaeota archaeon]
MAYKAIKTVIILIIFCLSIIFSIPIVIISTALSSFGNIYKSIQFYYNPSTPTFSNGLNIDIDIGEVEIEYITDPVSYYAKIDISIEMNGQSLAGKSYLDYFNIAWQNTSSLLYFTMNLKTGIDKVKILSLIKSIDVNIALKADVIYDIDIRVSIKGGARISVPYGVSVGNIEANVSRGNIKYNFFYCLLEGNISAIINDRGDLEMKNYDIKYTQNSTWTLYTKKGNIHIEISQTKATNANIIGNITIITGNYRLTYIDNTDEVGAYFILYVHPDDYAINQKIAELVGFAYYVTTVNGTDVYHLTSDDYPAQYNYNLLFNFPIGMYEELELQNT